MLEDFKKYYKTHIIKNGEPLDDDLFIKALEQDFDNDPAKMDAFIEELRRDERNDAQGAIVQSILEIADTLEEDKKEKIKDILNNANM